MYKKSHTMVIMGNWDSGETQNLETVLLETDSTDEFDGLRVVSVMYGDSYGHIHGSPRDIKTEIMNQLYDDMYDPEELVISCKEASNGKEMADRLCEYIADREDDENEEG